MTNTHKYAILYGVNCTQRLGIAPFRKIAPGYPICNLQPTVRISERSNNIARNLRINERIRVREVRVIDENNEQLGVMPTRDALSLAQSRGLDLVEVAPTAQPPVCRLLDYGKFRYDQGKREREQRKTQKTITIKELRLYPKMSANDQETRVKAARRFLEEGHKVKFVVQFKGRENAHTELGREMLTAISELLRDVGTLEQTPRLEGRNMSMMVVQRTDHARTTPRPPRDVAPDAETGNLPAAATAALAAAAANNDGANAAATAPATLPPTATASNDGATTTAVATPPEGTQSAPITPSVAEVSTIVVAAPVPTVVTDPPVSAPATPDSTAANPPPKPTRRRASSNSSETSSLALSG